MADQGRTQGDGDGGKRPTGELARLLAMLVAGGLIAAFAVLNTDEVEVNWVFGTFSTPLIIVILACLAVGLVVGIAGSGVRSRSKRKSAGR